MAGSGGSSPELMKPALEATIEKGEGMGRKRRARRSLPRIKTESRRLENGGRRGGADGSSGESPLRFSGCSSG
jgi:hypothetical protein